MPYSTLSDIVAAISEITALQLCDDDNVGAFVVLPPNLAYRNLVAAIAAGDTVIDSYLCGRYEVPIALESVPPIVKNISVDLAVCNMFGRRREMDVPEGIDRRYKNAIKMLESIRDGKTGIPEIVEAGAVQSSFAATRTTRDREFPDDLLNKF